MKYKKGDMVKVWSLQSWRDGGFLNGAEAIVIQDQVGDSIHVAVIRNFGGIYKLDESYEVYAQQCKLLEDCKNNSNSSFKEAYAAFNDFVKQIHRQN